MNREPKGRLAMDPPGAAGSRAHRNAMVSPETNRVKTELDTGRCARSQDDIQQDAWGTAVGKLEANIGKSGADNSPPNERECCFCLFRHQYSVSRSTTLFLGGHRKTGNHDPHIAQQEIADIRSLSASRDASAPPRGPNLNDSTHAILPTIKNP